MADKSIVDKAISDLTQAQQITGEDLFVLEQSGEAKKLKGSQVVQYAKDAVAAEVQGVKEYADTAKASADAAAKDAARAETAAQGIDDKVAAADASAKAAASSAAAAAASATGVDEKVQAAQTAADNAAKSETAAKNAQTGAANAQKAAESAQAGAQAAKTAAESAQEAAESAKDAAAGSSTSAGQKATQAAQSAENAAFAKSAAETAKTDAQAARDAIANMIVEAVTLETGEPATVSKSLVDNVYKLVFGLPRGGTGAPGPRGATGNGISGIALKSGTHAPGTSDIYTITLTDGTTFDFEVYNGANGQGAGDMQASIYDPRGKRTDVYKYVDEASVYEAKLKWGGENIFNGVSPIDAAIMPDLCTNRAAFANPKGISIEYSTDGGGTWQDYEASDDEKISLVTTGATTFRFGKTNESESSANMLRITVNAFDCNIYTLLRKIIIRFETRGNKCSVKFEKAYGSAVNDFVLVGDYQIAGNEGENSYEWSEGPFGAYTKAQANNIFAIRFTFQIASFGSSKTPGVARIMFLGETVWVSPSNMAKTGHLYKYDAHQNAAFPANVTATGFAGDSSDTVTKFTAATTRANVATGEKLSVLFGKIAKWFADLGSLAFKSTVAKSDLASDVQTSLGKADSALQSYTETDPTVPKWAKATTKPSYTASEVGALPDTTVIPSVPSTTKLLKGNGSGGLVAATPETDYASPETMRKVTLTTAGWNANTKQQTVTVSGVLTDRTKQKVICSPVDESYDSAWNTCYVQCVGHAADSLTFQCDEIPRAAVEVFVSIQSVSFVS